MYYVVKKGDKNGIPCLIKVLKEVFPLLGLNIIKEYSTEELKKMNESVLKRYSYDLLAYSPNKEQQELISPRRISR